MVLHSGLNCWLVSPHSVSVSWFKFWFLRCNPPSCQSTRKAMDDSPSTRTPAIQVGDPDEVPNLGLAPSCLVQPVESNTVGG